MNLGQNQDNFQKVQSNSVFWHFQLTSDAASGKGNIFEAQNKT